ncbi:MAG: ATP-binding cassette domain-containing protein [Verrucomicrobia bacterium]|nr:ATP-binding cassette domain-containing protein [Verrucomicrobiota bacterium]
MPILLRAQQLQGKRQFGDQPEEKVQPFDYAFESRRIYRLDGPDRGGKDLAWRLLTLLERPTAGELLVREAATSRLGDAALAELRNREVGYVFPTPYLLPGFTVVENVAMPLFKVLQVDPAEAKEITEELLGITGLSGVTEETPDGLTALQQQVAALARAVIHRPSLLGIESLGKSLAPRDALLFSEVCQRLVNHFGLTAVVTVAPGTETAWSSVILEVANGTVQEVVKAHPSQ